MPIAQFFLNPSSRWYYPLRWFIIILIGLGIYAQTFGFSFVFDDLTFIVNNPYIKRFDHLHFIWQNTPQTRTIGFYSFALNYHLNRLDPFGYHLFNFCVHLVATGLVWALSKELFRIVSKGNDELSFFVALLFLTHPCQTQAVSYISQRFESMATVFYLACIYFYLKARVLQNKNKIYFFICSAVSALLGIFTKEVVATIPLMILALELTIFNGKHLQVIKHGKKKIEKDHFWLISVVVTIAGIAFFLLFTKLVRTDLNIFFHFQPIPSQSHDGDVITVRTYLLTQMRVFLTFIRLLVIPIHQNLDYDYPLSQGCLNPPTTLIGLLMIVSIMMAIFKFRKKFPLIAFGLAWILITFSINLAPRANVIFEHKLYLISFGFFLTIVFLLTLIIKQQKVLLVVLMTLITLLSFISFQRNRVWANQITLWEDIVVQSPHKARGFNNLAGAYDKAGLYTQALTAYYTTIEINPFYVDAYTGLGNVYTEQGDLTKALFYYSRAIEVNPAYADAYYNRAVFYEKQGEFNQALLDYNKAILNNSQIPEYFFNRANVYNRINELPEATADYNKAIEIDPDNLEYYINRGNTFSRQKDYILALNDYNKVIDNNPDYPGIYNNRAVVYYLLKEYSEAWEDVHHAQESGIPVNPQFLKALERS